MNISGLLWNTCQYRVTPGVARSVPKFFKRSFCQLPSGSHKSFEEFFPNHAKWFNNRYDGQIERRWVENAYKIVAKHKAWDVVQRYAYRVDPVLADIAVLNDIGDELLVDGHTFFSMDWTLRKLYLMHKERMHEREARYPSIPVGC